MFGMSQKLLVLLKTNSITSSKFRLFLGQLLRLELFLKTISSQIFSRNASPQQEF